MSRRSRLVIDRAAGRRFVGDRPAEIDLGVEDLPVADGEALRVPEALAAGIPSFIGNIDAIAVGHHVDEIEAGDPCAVGPAASEIGGTIDAIVERAGEVEIVGDEQFQRGAVLVDVSLIAPASDSSRVEFWHGGSPSLPDQPRHPCMVPAPAPRPLLLYYRRRGGP